MEVWFVAKIAQSRDESAWSQSRQFASIVENAIERISRLQIFCPKFVSRNLRASWKGTSFGKRKVLIKSWKWAALVKNSRAVRVSSTYWKASCHSWPIKYYSIRTKIQIYLVGKLEFGSLNTKILHQNISWWHGKSSAENVIKL